MEKAKCRSLMFVFVVLGIVYSVVAAQEQQGEKQRLELNTILMESTFRVEGPGSSGPVVGTGFVLGRPFPKDPTRGRYVLVTAAHLLENITGEYATVVMRRKQGASSWERLPVRLRIRSADLPLWTKHPDADVAVMYIKVPPGVIIPLQSTDLLADDKTLEELEIHPGDELNALGYPFGVETVMGGFALLRSGKIASYPLVPTRTTRIFYMDFQIFPGNSGGPVYFVESNRAYGGSIHVGTVHFIIGLVSKDTRITKQIEELYGKREQQYPLGLAEIVHASLIREALSLLPPPDQIPE